MRTGTPGFVGLRLKEALEARSMPMVALAEVAEVSSGAISQYVRGDSTPNAEVLKRICAALNVPHSFFLRPWTAPEPVPFFFRSLSSATKGVRTRMTRKTEWFAEVTHFLRRFVHFLPVELPALEVPSHPREISREQIETFAQELRRFWKLGDHPVSHMVWLLESKGFLVARNVLADESIDAFSVWPKEEANPFVMLGADKSSAVRSRFDAAHELGHIVLHRHLSPGIAAAEHKLLEQQAHKFAGAFLLPEARFVRELVFPSLDGFLALKPRWRVSVQAMVQRSKHLGIIDEDRATLLYKSMSKRWGGRRQEPLDDDLEVEVPQFLAEAMRAVLQNGLVSRDQLASILPFSLSDVEKLLGLDAGTLDPRPPEPVLRANIIDISTSRGAKSDPAEVLEE